MADINILQLGKFWPVLGGVEKVMYDLTAGPDFDNDSPNSLTRVRDPFN